MGGAALATADAAESAAVGSPGVISGDSIETPLNLPVNLCGNTVYVVGLLNPGFGKECANR